jgi:hypothetical protein
VAFYSKVTDNLFTSSEHTRGPWDERSQHAGPPAALLGRAVEQVAPPKMRVARITFDIARPIPIGELTVTASVARQGRSVTIIEASLSSGTEPHMRGSALLIREAEGAAPTISNSPMLFHDAVPKEFFPVPYSVGYHTSMEVRFAEGSFTEPGPATCWMRAKIPLVEGEDISPLQRVLLAADSGNGVSSVLDFTKHVFINADLTVHLVRYPVGEWVCLQAATSIDSDGIGLADTALHDEAGQIGRAAQSLFVNPR